MNIDIIIFWPKEYATIDGDTLLCLCEYTPGSIEPRWHQYALASEALRQLCADKQNICVALPSELTLNIFHPLSKKESRYLHNTLPFIMENYVCEDIDSLSFSANYDKDTQTLDAIAINKEQLNDVITTLNAYSIPYTGLTSQLQVLPSLENCSVFFVNDSLTFLRINNVLAQYSFEQLLTRLPHYFYGSEISELNIYTNAPISQSQLDKIAHLGIDIQTEEIGKRVFFNEKANVVTALSPKEIQPILIAESNTQAGAGSANTWQTRIAATIFILGILLFSTYNIASGWIYHQKSGEITEQNIALYKTTFPEEKRVLNVRRQLEGKLNRQTTKTHTPILFNALAIIAEHKGETIHIQSISYNDKDNRVTAIIHAPTTEHVTQFRKRINQFLTSKVLSLAENKNTVKATIAMGEN